MQIAIVHIEANLVTKNGNFNLGSSFLITGNDYTFFPPQQ